MINATNIFFKRTKELMKEKGLSPLNYVVCFVCTEIEAGKSEVGLNILIVPIEEFEKDGKKLPFKSFSFYKKSGCLIASEVGSFFHLINTRVTIGKEGQMVFLKAPKKGRNSICWFIGRCLLEHIKNEKLTKRELARNLKMSVNKLNLIFKGGTQAVTLSEMIQISLEFEGKNKVSKYKVLFEKYPEKRIKKVEECEF